MVVLSSLGLLIFQQGADRQDTHQGAVFLGVIAGCMVLQALAVIGAGIAALMLMKKIDSITNAFDQKTTPIMNKVNSLIDELGPKIRTVSDNVQQTSNTVRVKVDELANTVDQLRRTVEDVNERSRVQISRVDGMVSDALATTYQVSSAVQSSIKAPIRQVAGIIAAAKTGIETLIARSPWGRRPGAESPYDL